MFGLKHLVGVLSFGLAWAALNQNDPVLVGQTFLAGSMDPTDGSAGWALVSHGVAEKLFTVDKTDDIIGQVGESVSKVTPLVWDVMLKADYKFSDGTPVTAQHVVDCLTELNMKNSNARSSLGNMTVTALDDLTVRIESERPTHVMDAVLAEWVFVVYSKNAEGKFLFTGPYVIETFGEDQIDMIPNSFYPASEQRPKITVKKFADGDALALSVKNKDVDIAFHLPVNTLPDLRNVEGVYIRSFEVGYHYMMFHNIDTLQDVRVRQAIDVAIDRTALSQAIAGGTATRSLFPDYSPYFLDETKPQGDADAAEALLEEAGWTLNENGKRAKDGVELTVHLVAYPHRPDLAVMQPIIAESLTDLGFTVKTTLTGDEWDETQTIIDNRSFDLLLWAQHTLPAGDPLWFLSAFFRSDGANNHSNLTSVTVDALLDQVSVAEEHQVRVARTADAHSEILSEVPVSNLITPFWHVALSERVKDYDTWGADYYVIRADLLLPETVPVSVSSGHRIVGQGILMGSLLISVLM